MKMNISVAETIRSILSGVQWSIGRLRQAHCNRQAARGRRELLKLSRHLRRDLGIDDSGRLLVSGHVQMREPLAGDAAVRWPRLACSRTRGAWMPCRWCHMTLSKA